MEKLTLLESCVGEELYVDVPMHCVHNRDGNALVSFTLCFLSIQDLSSHVSALRLVLSISPSNLQSPLTSEQIIHPQAIEEKVPAFAAMYENINPCTKAVKKLTYIYQMLQD